jgi:hypothetical protein
MSTKLNINIRHLIQRLKVVLSLKSDNELAEYLGVSRHTIATWKARNTIDYELIISKSCRFNLNWLFIGLEAPAMTASLMAGIAAFVHEYLSEKKIRVTRGKFEKVILHLYEQISKNAEVNKKTKEEISELIKEEASKLLEIVFGKGN